MNDEIKTIIEDDLDTAIREYEYDLLSTLGEALYELVTGTGIPGTGLELGDYYFRPNDDKNRFRIEWHEPDGEDRWATEFTTAEHIGGNSYLLLEHHPTSEQHGRPAKSITEFECDHAGLQNIPDALSAGRDR